MAYHGNIYLLLFLPAVVILYSLAPVRGRRVILLAANALFYFSFSRFLMGYLAGAALFTWLMGKAIGRRQAAEDAAMLAAENEYLAASADAGGAVEAAAYFDKARLTRQSTRDEALELLELACAGKTILVNTLEIPELQKIADYCAVFYEGSIVKILEHKDIDEHTVMMYSTGSHAA